MCSKDDSDRRTAVCRSLRTPITEAPQNNLFNFSVLRAEIMGLLTIIRKNRQKEKEMRLLFLCVHPEISKAVCLCCSRDYPTAIATQLAHSPSTQRFGQWGQDDYTEEAQRGGYKHYKPDFGIQHKDVCSWQVCCDHLTKSLYSKLYFLIILTSVYNFGMSFDELGIR